jgi:hypothetical protein
VQNNHKIQCLFLPKIGENIKAITIIFGDEKVQIRWQLQIIVFFRSIPQSKIPVFLHP